MKKKIVGMLLLMTLTLAGCGQREESVIGVNGQGNQSIVTEATTEPEATKAPEATAVPETTKIPEAPAAPETTKTPEATAAPETTKAPEATKVPETTVAPEATKATATPAATKEPEATAEPENTKPEITVDATKEPEEQKPDSTQNQEAPAKPEEPSTQVPAVTEAPVEQHQHTFVEESTPATCTEAEVITTVCSECGFVSGSRTGQGALGHDYHEVVSYPSTCNSYGWAANVCSRCGDSPSGRRLELADHDYEVTGVTEGSCWRERTTSYRCRNCGWETVEYGDFNYDIHTGVTTGTYEEYDWEKFEVITYSVTGCDDCGTVFEEIEIGREPIIPE